MLQEESQTINVYKPTQIVPVIKQHSIGRGLKLNCVTVKITAEEWEVCDTFSKQMWSQSKRGSYGKGVLNTEKDPAKTERTGLLGELAFAKISGLPMDISYSEGGADHDFVFNLNGERVSIDVKTAHKLQSYKSILIYAESGSGKSIPLKSDYYVGAYIAKEDIENKKATVIIVGYCHRSLVEEKPLVKAQAGHWLNKQIHYSELKEIDGLLELIQGDNLIVNRIQEEDNEESNETAVEASGCELLPAE